MVKNINQKLEYKICVQCVMDTSDEEIFFDENGVCNHCYNYNSRVENDLHLDSQGQIHLEGIIKKIKHKFKADSYDCIIGVSGGVDSTYVAYLAKKVFGLRPLAVHFDNGWNSELAVQNIEKTLNVLDIDLMTYVIDWEEFRELQRSFIKASVINWEIPTDHAITALLYRVANEHGIKYILGGGNITTEAIMPMSWVFYARDLKHIKAVHKKFSSKKLTTFPSMSMKRFIYFTFVRGIKWFPILNYVDYNKEHVMRIIQDELGWEYYGGKHYESVFTRFYQGYVLPKKFGVDKSRAHLSSLINSEQLTRCDALREIEKINYDKNQLDADLKFFLKKFNFSHQDFESILLEPPVRHEKFKSSQMLFKKFRSSMQWVKKIATENTK